LPDRPGGRIQPDRGRAHEVITGEVDQNVEVLDIDDVDRVLDNSIDVTSLDIEQDLAGISQHPLNTQGWYSVLVQLPDSLDQACSREYLRDRLGRHSLEKWRELATGVLVALTRLLICLCELLARHRTLQKLTPVDLNQLYRHLLETGRQPPGSRAQRPSDVPERAAELRATGLTYELVAEHLREEFPDEAAITKSAVAALLRRAAGPRSEDSSAGLSPRTVRYIHTILHAALRDALRWNRVVRNVADAATPPSAAAARSNRPKAWAAEQLRAFLDYAAESPYLPAWIFLATSGSRRGECLGLQWSDIDLDEATTIISRQVTALDHQVIVKELPKTKQAHLIRLDSSTVAMLRRLRAQQAEAKLRLGPGYQDEGYVFCQFDGRPHHPERFSREFDRKQRYFNRDHPDQLLPTITLHGLRHTWATLALSAGIDIKS
jgi:integrase